MGLLARRDTGDELAAVSKFLKLIFKVCIPVRVVFQYKGGRQAVPYDSKLLLSVLS